MGIAQAWSDLPLRVKGLVVVAFPVLTLIIPAFAIYRSNSNQGEAVAWVTHTLDVRTSIQHATTILLEAQSAIRGYGSTKNEQLLPPYKNAFTDLPYVLNRIKNLVQDNPAQTARVSLAISMADDRLTELKSLYGRYSTNKGTIDLRSEEDWSRLKPLRHLLETMILAEDDLLRERRVKSEQANRAFQAVLLGSLTFGLLGSLVASFLFTTGIVRRIQLLKENAERLATGVRLKPSRISSDEIGLLNESLLRTSELLAKRGEGLKLAIQVSHIAVWELDVATGDIRYEFADVSQKENESAPNPTTVEGWMAIVHTEDRDRLRQGLNDIMSAGNRREIIFRVIQPDGEIHHWALFGQSHAIDGASARRVVGTLLDITAAKRKEEQLTAQAEEIRQSQETLREQFTILHCVLSSIGDGVIVADAEGKVLIFNPAAERILQLNSVTTISEKWPEACGIFLPDAITPFPMADLPLARAIRGEEVDSVDAFVHRPGWESGVWISTSARPLRSTEGDVTGGVAVFRDVTHRKRSEQLLRDAKERAEASSHAKSDFLSLMSHELRTPLNSILGFAQVLQMGLLAAKPQECVEHILKAGKHLLSLIDEVLDISRIEAGQLALSPEPVRVEDSILQALDIVRPIAAASGVSLQEKHRPNCQIHLVADRQRLQQVLLNLLSNAIKYNRRNGTIEIYCEKRSASVVRVNVRDTGLGISPKDVARLFTPFERLAAGQSEVEGTGLGLALSKRLIESMNGCVGVESELGKGSIFWIELPFVEAPTERIDREGTLARAISKSSQYSQTVLYVEDNLSNVRLMEHILTYRPHVKLLVAMQGRLGFDLAVEHNPDLVFLDLHLPDLGGDIVLRQLRADARTSQTPTVMISADATQGQVRRLMESGATDYITKPIDVEKLLGILDAHLAVKTNTENRVPLG